MKPKIRKATATKRLQCAVEDDTLAKSVLKEVDSLQGRWTRKNENRCQNEAARWIDYHKMKELATLIGVNETSVVLDVLQG